MSILEKIIELDDACQFYDDACIHYKYYKSTDDDDLKKRCMKHLVNIYRAVVAINKLKQSHTIA